MVLKELRKLHLVTSQSSTVGQRLLQKVFKSIGNRKDGPCLQLHGHVSRQPMRCLSAMLEPKDQASYCISGSL